MATLRACCFGSVSFYSCCRKREGAGVELVSKFWGTSTPRTERRGWGSQVRDGETYSERPKESENAQNIRKV